MIAHFTVAFFFLVTESVSAFVETLMEKNLAAG